MVKEFKNDKLIFSRAENAVGRFETKARLIVLAPEKQKKPSKLVEILVDKTETVDNTVVFEVRVEGEPKPTVTWYLKGVELKQSDRIEIREFDGSIKLQIKNLKIEEAGEIKAVGTNSEGSDETRANLTVQKKPFAPEFDLRPKSLTVEKGSEAVFTAHAFGIPLPTYEWSVNGRKVSRSFFLFYYCLRLILSDSFKNYIPQTVFILSQNVLISS